MVNKTDVAYYPKNSITGYQTNKRAHPLAYGSANLEGWKYQDTVCLKQLNTTAKKINQDILNDNYCLRNFRFQVTTESKGLTMADGILGLSPRF